VTVSIDSLGGDSRCPVTSIVLTATAGSIGSLPQTVEVAAFKVSEGVAVPLSGAGYNAIYAVGLCNGGPDTTERSVGVSVYYDNTSVLTKRVLMTDVENGLVISCAIDGLSLVGCRTAASGFLNPTPVVITGSTAFIAQIGYNVIGCAIDGLSLVGCRNATSEPFQFPFGMTITGSTALLGNVFGPNVTACTVDGMLLVDCVSAGEVPSSAGFAITGSTAFVSQLFSSAISRCRINGRLLEDCDQILTDLPVPLGMAIKETTLFVTTQDGHVVACTIDGSSLVGCRVALSIGTSAYSIAITGPTAFVTFDDNDASEGFVLGCGIEGLSLVGCTRTSFGSSAPYGIAIYLSLIHI